MENELEAEELWGDEFGVPADVVAAFEPEERLAYVARLLETLALAYGVALDTHGAGLNPYESGPSSGAWVKPPRRVCVGSTGPP